VEERKTKSHPSPLPGGEGRVRGLGHLKRVGCKMVTKCRGNPMKRVMVADLAGDPSQDGRAAPKIFFSIPAWGN